jgi:thiamine biosynthesis lipoprotein
MLTIDFKTMGCATRVVLDAYGPAARAALDQVPAWFLRRERALSRFDPESALSRLNAAGVATHVDEVLWEGVQVALRAAASTSGLVTPSVLSALEAAGYDRSFDVLPRDQAAAPLPPRPSADWRAVRCDPRTRTIRLPAGLRLDLGGTAKGWSADAAVALLAPVGPALVDVGGDIALSPARGAPWPIAVGSPRVDDAALDLVLLDGGGVATSGRDFRRWCRAGRAQHHLIDPRTGAPSSSDVVAATVIAPSALDAEISAKRALLLGHRAGLLWLDGQPELAALLVLADGSVVRSARFARYASQEVA